MFSHSCPSEPENWTLKIRSCLFSASFVADCAKRGKESGKEGRANYRVVQKQCGRVWRFTLFWLCKNATKTEVNKEPRKTFRTVLYARKGPALLALWPFYGLLSLWEQFSASDFCKGRRGTDVVLFRSLHKFLPAARPPSSGKMMVIISAIFHDACLYLEGCWNFEVYQWPKRCRKLWLLERR